MTEELSGERILTAARSKWALPAILFALSLASWPCFADFAIEESNMQLAILEDGKPVLVYNQGLVEPPAGVDAERYRRSSYIHPLYGVNGEVLTEDFPLDHLHHRGLFWTWPETTVGGTKMDVWTLVGARQLFERWLEKEATADTAAVGVENGWYFDGDPEPKVQETIHFTVYASEETHRAIDFRLRFTNVCEEDVLFEGAKDKGYGGFSFRPRAENKPFTFDTATGIAEEDALRFETPWASVRWNKGGDAISSGVAMFQHPSNPGFPHPGWIFRHYAFLGVCWPHEQTHVLKPGEHFELQYRLLTHRGLSADTLGDLFEQYAEAAADEPTVHARQSDGQIEVFVGDAPFTAYKYSADQKYPYFWPINGPASGESVTTESAEPYPHHHSLFFGCDRVNGGNFWQDTNERGQILSQGPKIVEAEGKRVVFMDECLWKQPGQDAVMLDHRRIAVSAPSDTLRYIDFEITLEPLVDITIEKTNHSLFSARMAPELSVESGGTLVNAQGDLAEAGTFGVASPWCDYSGTRDGVGEGLAILQHPENRWFPAKWFTRDYGFFSPTPMYWPADESIALPKGEKLTLKYRVVVHVGDATTAEIGAQFEAYARNK